MCWRSAGHSTLLQFGVTHPGQNSRFGTSHASSRRRSSGSPDPAASEALPRPRRRPSDRRARLVQELADGLEQAPDHPRRREPDRRLSPRRPSAAAPGQQQRQPVADAGLRQTQRSVRQRPVRARQLDLGEPRQPEPLERPVGADELFDEPVGGVGQDLAGVSYCASPRPRAGSRSGRPS